MEQNRKSRYRPIFVYTIWFSINLLKYFTGEKEYHFNK